MDHFEARPRILVTGGSGYVGGRLVPHLLERGGTVRACGRNPQRLRARAWAGRVEILHADLADRMAVRQALEDIDIVLFLVHSMAGGHGYHELEAKIARIMAEEAERAGVSRIVYLSGLHPEQDQLSEHMASRERVARILRAGPVPTVVLQAATIIGAGSASFEIIRHLAERLPVMPAPSWVTNRIEPVAISDVLHYLTEATFAPEDFEGTYDLSSGETDLRFADLLIGYAEEAGLPSRRVLALPVPAPLLSGTWIGLVTPVPLSIAMPLAQSMQHDAISHGTPVGDVLPQPDCGATPYREAVRAALQTYKMGNLESSWDDDLAMAKHPAAPLPDDPGWSGHTAYIDEHERIATGVDPAEVWQVIESIGGDSGWYSTPLLWALRGIVDRILGGPGLRRGRRHPDHLREGDAVDWWRVERIDPGSCLTLRAEMRLTGRAWLQLSVEPTTEGARYRQRAVYFPDGLLGRLYWWAICPFHALIFPTMASNVMAAARRSHAR